MTPPPHSEDTGDDLHTFPVENEPFLAPSQSTNVTSDDRATRNHREALPTQREVSARLLRALPPQLSQWLQPAAPSSTRSRRSVHRDGNTEGEDEEDAASSLLPASADAVATRRLESGELLEMGHGSSRRRGAPSSGRPPVTLRVMPIVASRPSASTVSVEIEVNESELPALVPLTAAPQTSVDGEDGTPSQAASPRSTASSDDVSQHEEQSTMDELHTIFRRCHHSLPFAALFVVYFAYQHVTGIIVFVIGSVAIVGLDERLRTQIALKEDANRLYLVGIIAVALADAVAVSTIGGDMNPLRHLTRQLEPPSPETENPSGALFVDVIWLVLVNDFILRLGSLAVKAIVALTRPEYLKCGPQRSPTTTSVPAGTSDATPSVSEEDLEMGSRRKLTRSNVSVYRRKRKLYGIIELSSIFVRSLLAGLPWCSYYQLCSSKFMGNLFTFVYIFGKGIVLATQGRQVVQVTRSFMTQGLEHASYVTRDELELAGSPDCSICYEVMQTPVKLSCTHMFCEECVMEWFDRERSCPLCRAAVASTTSQTELKPKFLDGSTSLFPQLF